MVARWSFSASRGVGSRIEYIKSLSANLADLASRRNENIWNRASLN